MAGIRPLCSWAMNSISAQGLLLGPWDSGPGQGLRHGAEGGAEKSQSPQGRATDGTEHWYSVMFYIWFSPRHCILHYIIRQVYLPLSPLRILCTNSCGWSDTMAVTVKADRVPVLSASPHTHKTSATDKGEIRTPSFSLLWKEELGVFLTRQTIHKCHKEVNGKGLHFLWSLCLHFLLTFMMY